MSTMDPSEEIYVERCAASTVDRMTPCLRQVKLRADGTDQPIAMCSGCTDALDLSPANAEKAVVERRPHKHAFVAVQSFGGDSPREVRALRSSCMLWRP